jgi:ribose transport system substrate-binding protein
MRYFDQFKGPRGLLVAAAMLVLVLGLAACGGGGSSSSGSSSAAAEAEPAGETEPAAETGEEQAGASGVPHTVKASWGTFELDPKIAEKVENEEPINYLFSFEASGTPGFGEQFTAGFEYGCEQGEAIYPLHCEVVAPVQTNPNEQISQVQAKVAAGQVDCLSIQPPTETAVNSLINEVSAKGIPVFAVGEENHANALMNFTQHHVTEGEAAAETVIAFMKEEGKEFKNFALTSGLPTLGWAQGRMEGFEKPSAGHKAGWKASKRRSWKKFRTRRSSRTRPTPTKCRSNQAPAMTPRSRSSPPTPKSK